MVVNTRADVIHVRFNRPVTARIVSRGEHRGVATTPDLNITLVKDTLHLETRRGPLRLSQKWTVFYTLLAVNSERHVSTDEVCDHHPWSRLTPSIAGRDLWRFTRQQETRHFGQRITSSPARQSTKLFTLLPSISGRLTFTPDLATVADHLRSLREHRNRIAMQLSECTLLLQSGLVTQALTRLQELRPELVNINDVAHTETLITMCLQELHGVQGILGRKEVLEGLLDTPGLNRVNRARLLIRLARHATLSGQYGEAQRLFHLLRSLLLPEDGVEYCWYHANYGLLLRRTGHLEEALHHQRLAHDSAQLAQWWHGVYSASYNLALTHLSLAERTPSAAKQRHQGQAREWAMRAYSTAVLTRQPVAVADTSVLLALVEGRLGQPDTARHWLKHAQYRVPNDDFEHYPVPRIIYAELAAIEKQAGNHFLAHLARQAVQAAEQGTFMPLPFFEVQP